MGFAEGLYRAEGQRFANVAGDKTLPIAAQPEFNCVPGSQIADGQRVIHMMSAEKKAINWVNADETELFADGLDKTVKPAAAIRD
jgi:hypothetical protein